MRYVDTFMLAAAAVVMSAIVKVVVGTPSSLETRQMACTDPCTSSSDCTARDGCGDVCLTIPYVAESVSVVRSVRQH